MIGTDHSRLASQTVLARFSDEAPGQRSGPGPTRQHLDFDLFDASETLRFSGSCAWPLGQESPSTEVLHRLDGWMKGNDCTRIEWFELEQDRGHHCCGLKLSGSYLVSGGKRVESWHRNHGQRANGPDGWHYRTYDADGNIELEQVAREWRRFVNPDGSVLNTVVDYSNYIEGQPYLWTPDDILESSTENPPEPGLKRSLRLRLRRTSPRR